MTERNFIHETEDKYHQESKVKLYPKSFTTDVIKWNGDLMRKCRKKTENLNPKVFKTKNDRLIMHLIKMC